MSAVASEKLVRLSNGEIEIEDNVAQIVCCLRDMARERPNTFHLFVRWHLGLGSLDAATEAFLRGKNLLVPGEEKPVMYDDVKDVLDCLLILPKSGRAPKKYKLGNSPLHDDQADINPDDFID